MAGFRVTKRTAVLEFPEDSDFYGAEIRCRLDITTEAFFELDRLKAEADGEDDGARVRRMFEFFVDNIALDWNLEDEDGVAIPLTAEAFLKELPPALALRIIPLWKDAAMGREDPLDEASSSTESSPEELTTPPEKSSPSPES